MLTNTSSKSNSIQSLSVGISSGGKEIEVISGPSNELRIEIDRLSVGIPILPINSSILVSIFSDGLKDCARRSGGPTAIPLFHIIWNW